MLACAHMRQSTGMQEFVCVPAPFYILSICVCLRLSTSMFVYLNFFACITYYLTLPGTMIWNSL